MTYTLDRYVFDENGMILSKNHLSKESGDNQKFTVLPHNHSDRYHEWFCLGINKQVLYRTNEFFHQTDTYIRFDCHNILLAEYEQLIMVFENVSSETELI